MEKLLRNKLRNGQFNHVSPVHSRTMGKIKGAGNRTTEVRLRAALVQSGIKGWKVNYRTMKAAPDFYFPIERIAIFVDGCFWHGCPTCGHIPKTNSEFWKAKIHRNRERDKVNTVALEEQGIVVMRIWEHDLANSLARCVQGVKRVLFLREKSGVSFVQQGIAGDSGQEHRRVRFHLSAKTGSTEGDVKISCGSSTKSK